ncbi:MAG: hypothetical protein NTY80_03190 [candidate division SR1 bacterium]|nr:hypothetical protein [candidate division SR1 bacterium]
MDTIIGNLNFLAEVAVKTVVWKPTQATTNISKTVIHGKYPDFTKHVMSKCDMKRIIETVREEMLLMMPHEDLMGYIKGYTVHDLKGNIILIFGEKNIPKDAGFTLKKIFDSVVRSEENLELHALLKAENKIYAEIEDSFEEYS